MFEKNMKLAYLLDFYVDLFDEHAQEIIRAYYEDDLSLAEIAASVGISRQGIRHVIKKCEEQLLFFEQRLGLAKRQAEINEAIGLLNQLSPGTEEDSSSLAKAVKILEKGV